MRLHLPCFLLTLLFFVDALASAAQDGSFKPGSETVLKCPVCVAPGCIKDNQYAFALTMHTTADSDGVQVKTYTNNFPVDLPTAKLTAVFTTLGGVNTNGTATITNHLDAHYLISVDYAQIPPEEGKNKKDPVTVDYVIGINQACYRDMPKGMHTKDVQSVKAFAKR